MLRRALPLPVSLLRAPIRFRRRVCPVYAILLPIIGFVVTLVLLIKARQQRLHDAQLTSRQLFPGFHDDVFHEGCVVPQTEAARANATFVVLARNQELNDVVRSMKSLERHFNQWYSYPWVFLNDEEFSPEFKETVQRYTSGEIRFGIIPSELWDFPQEVREQAQFQEGIAMQGDQGVMYGAMESYHKMCRFYSGGFYKHELVRKYEWYWRVEPDVDFFCDIPYDPFVEMERQGKKYGFVIMIRELFETVPNLFRTTKAWFKSENYRPKSAWRLFTENYRDKVLLKDEKKFDELYKNVKGTGDMNSRVREVVFMEDAVRQSKKAKERWLTDDALSDEHVHELIAFAQDRHRLPTLQGEQIENEEYNLLHFWSNLEIARVDLWDNPVYESYFQYLEKSGGFFKERWGDAPVHSLAVGFLLDLNEVHYFRDIGYQHTTIRHCPANHPEQGQYVPAESYLQSPVYDAKLDRMWQKTDPKREYGVGCRCKCPKKVRDVEDSMVRFYRDWFDLVSKDWHEEEEIDVKVLERETRQKLRKEGLIA